MSATISVITITRNNLEGLQATAASLQTQSCRADEWIVIDGNSFDGTKKWLSQQNNLAYISEPDKGLYDAMNKGIDRATGDYLLFLNAGDRLAAPETLANIASAISDESVQPNMIYGDSLEAAPDEAPFYKAARTHRLINMGLFTHHQAILYRREALGDIRYDLGYKIAADYDLTLRFLMAHHDNVLYVPRPFCLFESGGVSQTSPDIGRKEQFLSRKRNGSCGLLVNTLIYLRQLLSWQIRRVCPGFYKRAKAIGVQK